MDKFKKLSILLLIPVVLISCNKVQEDKMELSISEYTFSFEGGQFEIGVDASGDWDVSQTPAWIETERLGHDCLIVRSAKNESTSPRKATLVFTCRSKSAFLNVTQYGREAESKYFEIRDLERTVFSKNGIYCAGIKTEESENGRIRIPVVMNVLTGDRTEYPGDKSIVEVKALSNDGRIVAVARTVGGGLLYCDENPKSLESTGLVQAAVESMSGDGRILVGYAVDETLGRYVPVKWTDFQPEVLEMPETNSLGEELLSGCMARGCSEDGSVIYGSEWDFRGLVYWKDGRMYFPGKEHFVKKKVLAADYTGNLIEQDVFCIITKYAEQYSISPNGHYIAAMYNDYKDNGDDNPATALSFAVIVDTQDNTAHFVKSDDILLLVGLAANNEGICFGGTPLIGVRDGFTIDYHNSVITPISSWLESNYGIQMAGNVLITGVSSDNNIVYGWKPEVTSQMVKYYGWCFIKDTKYM